MWFRSDNVAGVSPEIWEVMTKAAGGDAPPYGDDPLTMTLEARFSDLFEHECIVAPVGTGIAANALALSQLVDPLDAAIAHADSHIVTSEGGAFEFFTQGAKLMSLMGRDGKLLAGELEEFLASIEFTRAAAVPPRAITITQATERGTVYRLDEIEALASVAKRYGLHVHLDGARIANALVAIGCRPADMTWRRGVDALSFGATKNGAMMSDAVVIFDKALTARLAQRRRRSGQSASKMRFMSAQLHAYVDNDLWLRNARHANRMAKKLAEGLSALSGVTVAYPVEANMMFVKVNAGAKARLAAAGIEFRRARPLQCDNLFRLVTSFATSEAEISGLLARCRAALATGGSASD